MCLHTCPKCPNKHKEDDRPIFISLDRKWTLTSQLPSCHINNGNGEHIKVVGDAKTFYEMYPEIQ